MLKCQQYSLPFVCEHKRYESTNEVNQVLFRSMTPAGFRSNKFTQIFAQMFNRNRTKV